MDPKKIQHLGLYPDDEDTEAKTAYPDIIAHRRGTNENYLVIELKESTNTTDRAVDLLIPYDQIETIVNFRVSGTPRRRQPNAREPPAASRPELFHRLHVRHKLIEGDLGPLLPTRRFVFSKSASFRCSAVKT